MVLKVSKKSLDIIEYRKNNPCLTLQVIGDKFDISRERVRQILDRGNTTTKHLVQKVTYTCLYCGNKTTHKSGFCNRECRSQYCRIPLVCDNCGVVFYRIKSLVIHHFKPERYKGKVFCNRKCMHKYEHKHPFFNHTIYDYNFYDLKLFESLYKQNLSYKDIMLKMNINRLEFINIIRYLELTRARIKKHDWNLIKKLYLKRLSCHEISNITGVSSETIQGIITKLHKSGKLRVYKIKLSNNKEEK